MSKGKDKKSFKISASDRASLAASSFNAAAGIVAATSSKGKLDDAVEQVMDLTEEFYGLRIEWMEANEIGNAPKSQPSGGGGGNYKRSASSSGSSGGSSGPSAKQAGFYGDLIDSIEEAGGEAALSIKKFKKLSASDASDAIEEAIELRDELQD